MSDSPICYFHDSMPHGEKRGMDRQRSRVYRWEDDLWKDRQVQLTENEAAFLALRVMKAYMGPEFRVHRATHRKQRGRRGDSLYIYLDDKPRRWSWGGQGFVTIAGGSHRTAHILLHELAHAIHQEIFDASYARHPYMQGHGAYYTGILINLYSVYGGIDIDEVTKTAIDSGVKVADPRALTPSMIRLTASQALSEKACKIFHKPQRRASRRRPIFLLNITPQRSAT